VLLMTVFDKHLKKENPPVMSESATAPVIPSRTALLLMDYQNAIVGSIAEAEPVLDRARQALDWARKNDVQVVYVRVAFAPEDYAKVPSHSKTFAQVAESKYLADGSPEAALHESFEVRDGDIHARKTRYGAFSTTDLYGDLHARGVDTLVIGGISTSGVVLSTLRDAGDRDFRLLVLEDATADHDPEVHRVLIEKVFPHQADIVQTDDLVALSA
jgi:nicotinamidase-related amidase